MLDARLMSNGLTVTGLRKPDANTSNINMTVVIYSYILKRRIQITVTFLNIWDN